MYNNGNGSNDKKQKIITISMISILLRAYNIIDLYT